MKKSLTVDNIINLHPRIGSRLSLDSLTTTAGHLKLKLSQRSSYLTDGLSRPKSEYAPLEVTESETVKLKKKDYVHCGPFQRQHSLPASHLSNKQQSSVAINIIENNLNDHEVKQNDRQRTAPVIYGKHILTDKTHRKSLLKRSLNSYSSVSFVVGSIIGSGIFLSPSSVFVATGSAGMNLLTWFLCGLISMCAALCYIELGTEIPRSGAEFSYLKEGLGSIPAFLFSWASILIIRPSAISLISLTIGQYFSQEFIDDDQLSAKLIALVCIGEGLFFGQISFFICIYLHKY